MPWPTELIPARRWPPCSATGCADFTAAGLTQAELGELTQWSARGSRRSSGLRGEADAGADAGAGRGSRRGGSAGGVVAVRVSGGVSGLVAAVHGVLGTGGGHPATRGACGARSVADGGLRASGSRSGRDARQRRAVGGARHSPNGTAGTPEFANPAGAGGDPGRSGVEALHRRPRRDAAAVGATARCGSGTPHRRAGTAVRPRRTRGDGGIADDPGTPGRPGSGIHGRLDYGQLIEARPVRGPARRGRRPVSAAARTRRSRQS